MLAQKASKMIEIFDGKRYDISSDRTFTYRGTPEYLTNIRATINKDSGRNAPAADVDAEFFHFDFPIRPRLDDAGPRGVRSTDQNLGKDGVSRNAGNAVMRNANKPGGFG